MYQSFYLTTPEGEKKLAQQLRDDPQQVADCKQRLAELENLLKVDEGRCSVSRDQRNFLRRMLLPYA